MVVAVDIGGTKTLLALFTDNGQLTESVRFATNPDYAQFLTAVAQHFEELKPAEPVAHAAAGVPGLIDRGKGVVLALGNLPWRNQPIRQDLSQALGGADLLIENDTRLAGLYEARLIRDQYRSVLYITIGTGIGGALIVDGQIVTALQDTELGKMPLQHDGQLESWEDYAGGRGILAKYGLHAHEIEETATWDKIAEDIGYGTAIVTSVLQPDVIVFGGGVGRHAGKFKTQVAAYLNKVLHPVVKRPQLLAAQKPEEAVLYGGYELVKDNASIS